MKNKNKKAETDIDKLFKGFNYKKYNKEVRKHNNGTLEFRK